MTALVRSVITDASDEADMHQVTGSMSAKTGVAPT